MTVLVVCLAHIVLSLSWESSNILYFLGVVLEFEVFDLAGSTRIVRFPAFHEATRCLVNCGVSHEDLYSNITLGTPAVEDFT